MKTICDLQLVIGRRAKNGFSCSAPAVVLRYLVCMSALFTALDSSAFAAEPLRAGVKVLDITPPVPFRMCGYFDERLSTAMKDPLHAKAVVLQQGDQLAALVFCDVIGIPLSVSTAARSRASEATGIPFDHIAVAATHSHTGPLYFGALHDYFRQRSIERLGKDPYDATQYQADLVDRIVEAIVEARSLAQPVDLFTGNAIEDRLSFNRRFHMKDGSVRFNPGLLNPDIVRPAGPIDPQVGVALLSEPNSSRHSAAIVSFAMHLDTLSGTEYSADYPKYVEERLRKSFGPEFNMLFATGTCGDINHFDVTKKTVRATESIGEMLGETVERAITDSRLLKKREPALAVRSSKIALPLQKYSDGEIGLARKNMDLIGTRELGFLEQVEAYKIMDLQQREGGAALLEVQVFRLDPKTAIVMLPAEIFVDLGLAIKAASPFETTMVIELANDSLGYIPTKKAFAEGSYETVNSRVLPGGGEQLVETAITLLKELE